MADNPLAGMTALVTGASKRIGRAISSALANDGVNVVVHYNQSADEAGELRGEIIKLGVESWTVQADFGNPDEYGTLIERAVGLAGSLSILVNSVSIFPESRMENITFDGLMQTMQVNAWVPFELGRDFAESAGKGKIVNLLDTRHLGYDWKHAAYILSKKTLFEMTKMMAMEFAPDIAVNAVAPGLILPPPGKDQAYLDKLVHTVPLNRHGNPEDVASAVIFLLKNDFLTGEVIYVDGGRHLRRYTHG